MKKHTFRKLGALLAASVITAVCSATNVSANDETASVKLTETSGIAGQAVVVNVELETGNICTGYDIDIEFDNRLELINVSGYFVTETIGNVATIINLTALNYEDNVPVSALTFLIPDDADEGDSYDINISRIGEVTYDDGFIENMTAMGTTINVLESAKQVTNYLVYVAKDDNGVEVSIIAPRGDADMDGEVDIQDAIGVVSTIARKRSLGSAGEYFADINSDGKVDFFDALGICRYMLFSEKSNAWETII